MSGSSSAKIDFNEWSGLATSDPEAFEAKRAEMLEQLIAQCRSGRRERLRRLQWRIDQIRRLAHTPLGACIKINSLMLDAVLGDGGLLESMSNLTQPKQNGHYHPLPEALILPFVAKGPPHH